VRLIVVFGDFDATCVGAFGGYILSVTESHQTGKADTSGTAKDMVNN
jgi:hypothetical protein